MFESFGDRLQGVRDSIERACARSGRNPSSVNIIAVTKGHPFEAMQVARASGLVDLGENRVQDALPKLDRIDDTARVHFIGRLQTNKVNKVVGRFASIMAVDRVELFEKIQARATEREVVQAIWIQVNASKEDQKGGCVPAEAAEFWSRALESASLRPLGLMTMGRVDASESELRSTFAELRTLAGELRQEGGSDPLLSMGMSGDFALAVEEGATHLRLGTVLFGPRA